MFLFLVEREIPRFRAYLFYLFVLHVFYLYIFKKLSNQCFVLINSL